MKTIEQMECLKHWLSKGWLDQLNVELPPEECEGEAEGEAAAEGDTESESAVEAECSCGKVTKVVARR